MDRIFSYPRLDIFHYCGHSEISNNMIHFRLIQDLFPAIDISLQYPALFFLNMCESDITITQKIYFKGYEKLNFPFAVMKQGARACVATLWPVVDETASRFAIKFYEEILNGTQFGTAIRSVKARLAKTSDPNDVTWLSFVIYGSPYNSTLNFKKS
ncbi:MAG: CHAT domain-containing protein [Promethearchaeota archaeon]